MRRSVLFIIGLSYATSFLFGCAHIPVNQKGSIFVDPKNEKRATELRAYLHSNPGDVEKCIELGRIFLKEQMMEEAVAEFEKTLRIDPRHIEAHLLLASAIQKLPNPDLTRAATLLENASRIAPKNGKVRLNLAQVYDTLKEEEKAIGEFENTLEFSRDAATLISAHLGLMSIYKKRGELVKADQEYEAARKIYPSIDELIKEAEIRRITPPPKYAGEGLRGDDDGFHPSHERRIENIRQIIERLQKEKKD